MARKNRSTLGQWADAYAEPAHDAEEPDLKAGGVARPSVPAGTPQRETYYLSADLIEAVRDAAVHLGVPKGEVVEIALRAWLATQQIPPRTRRVRRGRPVE